jgi:hypothetical protein
LWKVGPNRPPRTVWASIITIEGCARRLWRRRTSWGTTVDRCGNPLDDGVRRAGAEPAREESTMTDHITVDFNSRDAQGVRACIASALRTASDGSEVPDSTVGSKTRPRR